MYVHGPERGADAAAENDLHRHPCGDMAGLDLQSPPPSCGHLKTQRPGHHARLPQHTSFIRNAIIILLSSLSPIWYPYLESIFSGEKTQPFSSPAYKPTK